MRTEKRPVLASRAVVTANRPEASAAGLEMLAMGGNAVDAAVATLFSLSVVEPMMVSPCGAGFFVIRDGRTGEVVTLDNYATVPGKARAEMFRPVPGSLENETVDRENDVGYLAVGVPGALAGWCLAAARFGSLPLAELVGPAVRQARRGFLVSPYLSQCIELEREALARFWASAATFLPEGRVPQAGERIVRADYADTLERMGRNGAAELVSGETALAMAADMEVNGGLVTPEDLAGYRVHEREPVRGCYRGYDVVAMGPVSSGGTHLAQMLAILEGFDLRAAGFGTVETVHVIAEVLKIAFADRFRYMADPAAVEVPVGWLISAEYAAARCAEVMSHRGKAGEYRAGVPAGWGGESGNTTHLNVVDADGTVVSATQTLNNLFGSRVTTPGTGMLLNNCMHLMDPVPGRTNSIAPGKRILSSMSPTLLLCDAGDRDAGREPHLRDGAAGDRQPDRPRDDGAGGGGGAAGLDDGTGPGDRGHVRAPAGAGERVGTARPYGASGAEDRGRNERDPGRSGDGTAPRRELLAGRRGAGRVVRRRGAVGGRDAVAVRMAERYRFSAARRRALSQSL